jgi:hypothetical protein
MKNWRLKAFSLLVALALWGLIALPAKGAFYWDDDGKGEKEISISCEQLMELQEQAKAMANIVYDTSGDCWNKHVKDNPECLTYHATMTFLAAYYGKLVSEHKTQCKEAKILPGSHQ